VSAVSIYHCELAWLGGPQAAADVVVEVSDGLIVDVRAGVAAVPGAVRLAGLTLPGFANAHSHAFHRALRGRTHSGTGSFWTWREQMYRVASRLTPTSYAALATATYAEMVSAGITAVGEFHYLHHDPTGAPYGDPNELGEVLIAAAARAGLRITLLDTCYLHGGIEPDGTPLAPNEVQRRFSDGSAAAWSTRASALAAAHCDSRHARVGAAIHSVRAVDPEAMRVVSAWAAEHDAPLHAHVSEQPAENEQCLAAYGRTPTALLHSVGALGSRFTAVHGTHLTSDDIGLYGTNRSSVCFCPTTERDLADGIGSSGALRAVGVQLCLGSDSHAFIDPFEDMRALELDERLATLVRGSHDVPALLEAATRAGHRSIGWTDAGEIAVGRRADLVSVGLDSVRLAGCDAATALAAVVFAASPADVHHVVVDGEAVVRQGRHVRIEVGLALRDAIAALDDEGLVGS
jgi:formiminoglutamate deiminase